jgi:phospholipase C
MRPIGRKLAACATTALFMCSALVPANATTLGSVSRNGHLSDAQTRSMVAALRQHVKYVFVLYQENRSFDSYFGTFPGANGLFSQQPANTPGYYQPIENTDGTMGVQTPFRIDPSWFSADTDDGDHSHPGIVAKMDVTNGAAQMDDYSLREEADHTPSGPPSEQAKQYGELVMGHEDCNTVPIYWNYAKKFVLLDNIFQTETTPSTPGNIAIFSGQAGLTQLAEHPSEMVPGNGGSGPGVPVLNDSNPFWGSSEDPTGPGKMPYNPGDGGTPQLNLTFASLPLTLAGKSILQVTQGDRNPASDLADVQLDLPAIHKDGGNTLDWGWFQEGFDKEPTDPPSGPQSGTHTSYITHHNGPQYFGYLSNNPTEQTHFHGIGDFFNTVSTGGLAASGGVYYLKGGYQNIFGLTPTDPDPAVQKNFVGDDDHPAYADAQISEANVAEAVNTIATASTGRRAQS